jgi:hypothetical protein
VEVSETRDAVQLSQTSQVFNIFGEGQRQLLDRRGSTHHDLDSCCDAK